MPSGCHASIGKPDPRHMISYVRHTAYTSILSVVSIGAFSSNCLFGQKIRLSFASGRNRGRNRGRVSREAATGSLIQRPYFAHTAGCRRRGTHTCTCGSSCRRTFSFVHRLNSPEAIEKTGAIFIDGEIVIQLDLAVTARQAASSPRLDHDVARHPHRHRGFRAIVYDRCGSSASLWQSRSRKNFLGHEVSDSRTDVVLTIATGRRGLENEFQPLCDKPTRARPGWNHQPARVCHASRANGPPYPMVRAARLRSGGVIDSRANTEVAQP